jgi:hypothetical protein
MRTGAGLGVDSPEELEEASWTPTHVHGDVPRAQGLSKSGPFGRGLIPAQIDDITDFIENGLYDSTFATSFQPTADDLNYSQNHPTLAAKGAVDGVMLNGSAVDDNDHLSPRDQGLEFLNVDSKIATTVSTVGTRARGSSPTTAHR